jgi:phosphoribosylformimino-5-aminoimidazole carboxamide ribonucleotide (ProFAR) isomerase
MSRQARRKRCQAVRLLDQAVRRYKVAVQSSSSYQPNTDTSVTTFERYLKRLEKLVDVPGAKEQFWSLHQKVYIRLLKHTLKLRN